MLEKKTKVVYDVFDSLFVNGVTYEPLLYGKGLGLQGRNGEGDVVFGIKPTKFGNILLTMDLEFICDLCNIEYDDIRPHLINYFRLTFPNHFNFGKDDFLWIHT
jgi:hypothetical protein